MKKILFLFFAFFVVFNSCKNDNEEDASIGCRFDTITYKTLKATFDNNCISCHSESYFNKDIKLDTYEGVKNAANRTLLRAIRHEAGITPMPFGGGSLSDCEIKSIESWISRNFPQ